MNPNIDYIELEDLLNNRVSEETQKALEQQIATDESFAEELAFYKDLRKVVEHEGDANLAALIAQTKNKLTAEGFFATEVQIVAESQQPTTAKIRQLGGNSRKLYSALAIAASITLVAGIFGWWTIQQQYNSESLAFNNFESDIVPNSLRGDDNQTETKIDGGIAAFNDGNYELAVDIFKSPEIQNDSLASTAAYYLGQTYFKQQQYDLAAEAFQKVVLANDLRFKDNAEWYEVLSNLASNKDVTAALAAIAENENHTFSEQAKVLQSKLNSVWRKLAQ